MSILLQYGHLDSDGTVVIIVTVRGDDKVFGRVAKLGRTASHLKCDTLEVNTVGSNPTTTTSYE